MTDPRQPNELKEIDALSTEYKYMTEGKPTRKNEIIERLIVLAQSKKAYVDFKAISLLNDFFKGDHTLPINYFIQYLTILGSMCSNHNARSDLNIMQEMQQNLFDKLVPERSKEILDYLSSEIDSSRPKSQKRKNIIEIVKNLEEGAKSAWTENFNLINALRQKLGIFSDKKEVLETKRVFEESDEKLRKEEKVLSSAGFRPYYFSSNEEEKLRQPDQDFRDDPTDYLHGVQSSLEGTEVKTAQDKIAALKTLFTQYETHLESSIIHSDQRWKLTATQAILYTLTRRDMSEHKKLEAVNAYLKGKGSKLSETRDDVWSFILKLATTLILTGTVVGLYWVPGMWRSHGKEVVNKATDIIADAKPFNPKK